MNKTIRLSAAAAACVFCTFLSASEVKADGFILTSDQGLLIEDTAIITTEDVLITEGPGYIGQSGGNDTILTDGSGDVLGDDILSTDNRGDILNGDRELLLDDPGTVLNGTALNKEGIGSDTVLYSEDEILTDTGKMTDSSKGSDTGRNTGSNKTIIRSSGSSNTSKNNKESSSSTQESQKKSGSSKDNTKKNVTKKSDTKKDSGSDNSSTPAVTETMKTMLNAINKRRAAAGVSRLTFSSELNRIASLRAVEVSKCFSHNRANGKNWISILTENGVPHNAAGENLACRITNPELVVMAWSRSPSHNRCMLNGDYNHAGIGTITVNGCTYWTLTLTD